MNKNAKEQFPIAYTVKILLNVIDVRTNYF